MHLIVVGALGLLLALGSEPWVPPAVAGSCSAGTELVSRANDGAAGDKDSWLPAPSADGCVIAFKSQATNLVLPTPTSNGFFNIFVRDRVAQLTSRIPPRPDHAASNLNEANGNSYPPALNACPLSLCLAGNDGNLIAFASAADNLVRVPADVNQSPDVFAFDRSAGTTEGLTFAFIDATGAHGGGGAATDEPPSVCADGSLVALASTASNLVSGENPDAINQVYVHDRGGTHTDCPVLTNADPVTGNLLVSAAFLSGHAALGASAGPAISGNGCIVSFYSDAGLNGQGEGTPGLVPGDTNGDRDVFVRDICKQTTECNPPNCTERVNVSSTGEQAVRPHDRTASDTHPNLFTSAVSYDGRYVVFASDQGGLDDLCTDPAAPCWGILNIFVRDRCESNGEPIAGCTLSTVRVSKQPNGEATTVDSQSPSISADGRFIVFQSADANLVDPPTNGQSQIFVVDFTGGMVRPAVLASVSSGGDPGNGDSINPQISGDGLTIVFQSKATNLISDSTGGASQIFAAPNPPTPTFTSTASPTETETATPTNTVPTETPTPTDTPTLAPTVTITSAPTSTSSPPSTFTPTPTATRTPSPTPITPTGVPTATPRPTVTVSSTATPTPTHATGGGGGGGCSCGIDPGASAGAGPSAIFALAFPLLLRWLRPRTRRW
jgi:hypothetical protein